MDQSIAQQFVGAVGPAFDHEDLALALGLGNRVVFASASSSDWLTVAAESAISMINRARNQDEVVGVAALLRTPETRLLGGVRSLTKVLREAFGNEVHIVTGGVAADEGKAKSDATVSVWVCVR